MCEHAELLAQVSLVVLHVSLVVLHVSLVVLHVSLVVLHVSLVVLCGGNHDELIHMEWMKKHQEISLPLPHIGHHTIKGEVKWPAFYFRCLQSSTTLRHLCRCPSDLCCQLTITRKSVLLWLPV